MSIAPNLIGKRFGRLVVVRKADSHVVGNSHHCIDHGLTLCVSTTKTKKSGRPVDACLCAISAVERLMDFGRPANVSWLVISVDVYPIQRMLPAGSAPNVFKKALIGRPLRGDGYAATAVVFVFFVARVIAPAPHVSPTPPFLRAQLSKLRLGRFSVLRDRFLVEASTRHGSAARKVGSGNDRIFSAIAVALPLLPSTSFFVNHLRTHRNKTPKPLPAKVSTDFHRALRNQSHAPLLAIKPPTSEQLCGAWNLAQNPDCHDLSEPQW